MRHRYYHQGPWQDFSLELDSYERAISDLKYLDEIALLEKNRASDISLLLEFGRVPTGAITSDEVKSLLTSLGPPHGYALLEPAAMPAMPQFPSRPSTDGGFFLFRPKPKPGELNNREKRELIADRLQQRVETLQQEIEADFRKEAERLATLRNACVANDVQAIKLLMSISHLRHWLPAPLRHPFDFDIDQGARIALCTIEIPDFNSLNIVKKRGSSLRANWLPVSPSEKKRLTETILYSLCIRSLYLVAQSDEGNWFDTIAINAKQNWNDRATGSPRTGIIASLHATTEELIRLRVDQVDPKTCFRHLKGISTSSVEDVSPILPIFVMNKEDDRIIKQKDVAQAMEPEANLAAMPWDDFEHLVRQLYEWEWGSSSGAEVKVTRSSRDRGVDAIVFDPDPLRGGKYVIQAKRYTRPVDVAAVRDLYGTLLNEGTNKGILVTTSYYGPDAYAFARGKPISLVDGPRLIEMLREHGRHYKIDLEEARRLAAQAGGKVP